MRKKFGFNGKLTSKHANKGFIIIRESVKLLFNNNKFIFIIFENKKISNNEKKLRISFI